MPLLGYMHENKKPGDEGIHIKGELHVGAPNAW